LFFSANVWTDGAFDELAHVQFNAALKQPEGESAAALPAQRTPRLPAARLNSLCDVAPAPGPVVSGAGDTDAVVHQSWGGSCCPDVSVGRGLVAASGHRAVIIDLMTQKSLLFVLRIRHASPSLVSLKRSTC